MYHATFLGKKGASFVSHEKGTNFVFVEQNKLGFTEER
jgi:hypothetical protein